MKKITVQILGTPGEKTKIGDVKIVPGTTIASLRKQLDIPDDFPAFRVLTRTFLEDNERLDPLNENEKIQFAPRPALGFTPDTQELA